MALSPKNIKELTQSSGILPADAFVIQTETETLKVSAEQIHTMDATAISSLSGDESFLVRTSEGLRRASAAKILGSMLTSGDVGQTDTIVARGADGNPKSVPASQIIPTDYSAKSRSSMTAISIPASINAIFVGGYSTPGDGGAGIYKRVATQPTHAGKFTSADGAFWELVFTGEVPGACFGVFPADSYNNAPSLNAAITFVNAKGGGFVTFGPGEHWIAGEVFLKSRVIIKGAGRRATIFKRMTGYNGDMFKTEGFDTYGGGSSANGPNRFGIHHMTLHGSKDWNPSATGWCLRIYGRAYSIREVDIEYCAQGGFSSQWSASAAAWDNDNSDSIMESLIDGLFVQFSKGTPVFDGPHDSQISRMIVSMSRHNQAFLSGSSSLIIGDRAGGTQILSLHIWGDSPEWCLTNWASSITITDLLLDDARANGGLLKMRGSECRIQGRGMQYGSESLVGLQIEGSAKGNVIDLLFTKCPTTSVNFVNDGGNHLVITVNANASTPNWLGTPHANTTILYTERGAGAGANDFVFKFGAATINRLGMQLAALTGDPTDTAALVDGFMYYNSTSNTLRIRAGGAWKSVNLT